MLLTPEQSRYLKIEILFRSMKISFLTISINRMLTMKKSCFWRDLPINENG